MGKEKNTKPVSCDLGRRKCSDNHSDIFRNDGDLFFGVGRLEAQNLIIGREHIENMESMVEEKGRYSAESIRISRAKFDLKELDRLADHSRALANDTLYLLRQYYFYHTPKNLENKNFYRRNIETKYYKTIEQSEYLNEEKERAFEILEAYFRDGLRALKSILPTVMKFMESYKDIGYAPCAQQIVKSVCETFMSHLGLIRDYNEDLKKWRSTAEDRRGRKPSRPGLPRYFGKKVKGERIGKWKLIYTKQKLGHTKNLESLRNALDNNYYTCYMYVPPSHDHIIPPIRVRTKVLSQLLNNGGSVEIIPKGNSYSFSIHYIKTKRQRAREYGLTLEEYEQNPNRAVSIDIGVNNFLTIFNNFSAKFILFKGSAIKRWNYRINHTIPKLQREVDVIADVVERYEITRESLGSIITSRIHTYHDEFEILRAMIFYIFRKISELSKSKLDIHYLDDQAFILECFQSRSFFRVIKSLSWSDFKEIAEADGKKIYQGIFNKVRKIILMDPTPRERDSLLFDYLHYLQNKRDYKIDILRKISRYPIHDLQDYLKRFKLRIDALWDKYYRVKRDAINKITKKLFHYCLYYKVGTITIGYNKGWKSGAVKLRKLIRDLFVSLPFNQMLERIQLEALYFGITVDFDSEWYTSKCSFIDGESIGSKPDGTYAGKRRFTHNGVKHNGLFRSRNGHIIHGDINGTANIGRKNHPKLFSHKTIAYNLGVISDPGRPLTTQARQKVIEFITTAPIKFSPSNEHPTKELKWEERLNKSKIKPQRYQMSPSKFLVMTQTTYM